MGLGTKENAYTAAYLESVVAWNGLKRENYISVILKEFFNYII
jgi:hypothetical protein